jgi:hypothetical protein
VAMGEVPRALYDAFARKELNSSRRTGTLCSAGMSFASQLDRQIGVIA